MNKNFRIFSMVTTAILAAPLMGSAQTIVFAAPAALTSASQVIDNGSGSVVYAVSFGSSGTLPSVTLPSGTVIPFTSDQSGSATTVSFGVGVTPYGTFGVGTGTDTTGNANLDTDLNHGDYTGGGTNVELILNGLTVGQSYELQAFAADDRNVHTGQTFDLADTAALLSPLTSAQYAFTGSTGGAAGAEETGTFIATGTTETFYSTTFNNNTISGTQQGLQINGLILETVLVPEPSTYALMGMGLFGLVVLRRFRRSNS
jgi:hypothetical protein